MADGNSLLDALAHPTVVNPLAAFQGAAQTANAIWQTRDWQAKQAAGDAQRQAIDPNGVYQPSVAGQNLSAAGPNAALAMPAALESNQRLSDAQLEQARKKTDWVNSAAGATLQSGDYSDAAMLHLFQTGMANGMLTLPEVQKQLATLPPDPAGRQQWMQQHQMTAAATQLQLAQTYGTRQPVNSGGATTFPVVPPASAGGAGPTIPTTPSPAERNATQQTWNPTTRQFEATPRQDVAPMVDGQGNPVPGSAVPGLPSSGRPAAGAASGPKNIAQPSPGTEDEMKGSAAHLVTARDAANNYQQTIQPIEGALAALKGADTGKGGEVLNTIRAYAQDVAPGMIQRILPSSLMDKDARVAFDEANKYTTGMALAAPGGSRSNAGEAAASAANPSVHISNAAAQLVARAILAQKRLTQAGTLAFNTSGQAGGNYDAFMNTWNTNQDARAFIADRMTPAERAATVKDLGGIGSPAYQRYKASYLAAQAAKVTDAPTN